jgi:iron(III) transport system ATP-binding protein
MAEPAVRVGGLSKRFGDVRAADDIGFDAERGEFLALLGPSGCGKTTTLRLIAGFERPDAGRVVVGGRVVAAPGTFVPPERRRVGMVFQDHALFPHLDVARNVGYGLSGRVGRADRVREMLELVGLVELGARMPHELSGGQQQRVALARALAPKPEVLLLDEPFSNLDAALRARVRAEVREILRTAGATAIFVTHDREEALSLADRVAVLWQGRLIQIARPDELYRRPASPEVAAFIGDADLFPGRASGGSVACELGTLPVCPPAHGPVHVLIRPESVRLVAAPDGSAVVTAHEFYGHDQVVIVRLASGRPLRARLGPRENFRPGDCVEVGVEGPVSAFPDPSATGRVTAGGS